jgi:sugar-phosphatase
MVTPSTALPTSAKAAPVIPAEGLLFDCDGVLVDSDEAAAQAWNSWAAEFAPGFDFARDITHGRPAGDTVAELVPARDLARAIQALMQREIDTAPMVHALPGAAELLPDLPRGSWTVVTSAVPAVARARLAAAGLPCPPDLVTAWDVSRGKPAPDPYRIGAERLRIAPARGVVFEDAEAGVTSALAAGIGLTVGVGERGLRTRAHLVVADLCDVRYDGSMLDLRKAHILRHPDPGHRSDPAPRSDPAQPPGPARLPVPSTPG